MPIAKVTLVDPQIDAAEIAGVDSFGAQDGGALYLWDVEGNTKAIVASGQWVAAGWKSGQTAST